MVLHTFGAKVCGSGAVDATSTDGELLADVVML